MTFCFFKRKEANLCAWSDQLTAREAPPIDQFLVRQSKAMYIDKEGEGHARQVQKSIDQEDSSSAAMP